jgi:hypothetical protein
MNKRTHILKQMTSEKMQDASKSVALPLLATPEQLANPFKNLLNEQILTIADQLKIKADYLHAWLGNFHKATVVSQFSLLHLIERYGLDPFLEEVDLVQYEDHSWQAVITPQGYARLINACPQFKGLTYCYSDSDCNAISAWIECTIYRTDRDNPITVREYYVEVKRDSPIWQKMPRRMLRNRAFQQCAKLALGI